MAVITKCMFILHSHHLSSLPDDNFVSKRIHSGTRVCLGDANGANEKEYPAHFQHLWYRTSHDLFSFISTTAFAFLPEDPNYKVCS